MQKRVVLTGASGALGRMLSASLAQRGHRLLLSDNVDFPDRLPEHAVFRRIDLCDREAMLALAQETAAVLHFGAASTERSFEEILAPNIRGVYHVFELARLAKARVIFASSNHTIGFHERGETLDEDCDMRPDTFYGLSKAYGELLGRLYWDKHGVESLSLRIGTCLPAPKEVRHLSTWLSHGDLVRLIEAGLAAPHLGCRAIWGVSANQRSWWRCHDRDLGIERLNDAERHAAELQPAEPARDPVTLRYQGGSFCAEGYTRSEPSPADIFDWLRESQSS